MKGETQRVTAAHRVTFRAFAVTVVPELSQASGVHGLPWLRVADASLFPDALEINPYLTIMAPADRVADGVLADAHMLRAPTSGVAHTT